MKYEYKITYGLELDKDGKQVENKDLTAILTEVAKDMGGFSLIDQTGGYVMKNNQLVIEKSQTLVILANKMMDNLIVVYAKAIKNKLNQESVIVYRNDIKGKFV